jgi:hypothetical protein
MGLRWEDDSCDVITVRMVDPIAASDLMELGFSACSRYPDCPILSLRHVDVSDEILYGLGGTLVREPDEESGTTSSTVFPCRVGVRVQEDD